MIFAQTPGQASISRRGFPQHPIRSFIVFSSDRCQRRYIFLGFRRSRCSRLLGPNDFLTCEANLTDTTLAAMALEIMLAQQVFAVVVAVGGANDGVDVLARGLVPGTA